MGETLAVSFYKPKGEPKAVVEIVHGMAEHRKRYADFAKYLMNRGFAVYTYDLPGHGETAGTGTLGYFGEANGWTHLVNSAYEVAQTAKAEYPDKPFILLGHSMGSMIARCFLQTHDDMLDALVLSGAPCYQSAAPVGIGIGKALKKVKGAKGYSKVMDFLLTGTFAASIKNARTPFDWLSVNKENVDRYIADPLCGFPFTIQGYIDELQGVCDMHNVSKYHCTKPDLPVLFAAGEYDPCTGGTKGLADSADTLRAAGYSHIDARLFEGMRHEILNECDREKVFAAIAEWIETQL